MFHRNVLYRGVNMVLIQTEPTIDALKQSTILKVVREMASTIDANNKKLEDGYNNLPDTQQITADIATLKADTANLRTKDTDLQAQIRDNKANITANTAEIAEHTEEIAGLTKELLDELLLSKVGNGIQLRFVKEDGDYVDSNVLTTATPTTARLLPGTTDRTFKLSIDLADGTSVVTNDFVIPEGGGTEVVVTGVTIQAGTGENSFNVAIQLSDGTPITSNDWTINIPAVTIQLEQTVNGISIQGTALQKATTAQDGLMTKAQATAIAKNTSDITAVDAKVDGVSDTVGDHTTIINAHAQAITELEGEMGDVVATLPQAFTGMNIAESSTGVTVEMTKADGMTTISETIPSATPTTAGVMSAEDKAKLDSLRLFSNNKYLKIFSTSSANLLKLNGTTEYTGAFISSFSASGAKTVIYDKYSDALVELYRGSTNLQVNFPLRYTVTTSETATRNYARSGTFTLDSSATNIYVRVEEISKDGVNARNVNYSSIKKLIVLLPYFYGQSADTQYLISECARIELDIVNGTWMSDKPVPLSQAFGGHIALIVGYQE